MCYSWLAHQKYTYGNENNVPVSQDNPLNLLTVYTEYHLRGSVVIIVYYCSTILCNNYLIDLVWVFFPLSFCFKHLVPLK